MQIENKTHGKMSMAGRVGYEIFIDNHCEAARQEKALHFPMELRRR